MVLDEITVFVHEGKDKVKRLTEVLGTGLFVGIEGFGEHFENHRWLTVAEQQAILQIRLHWTNWPTLNAWVWRNASSSLDKGAIAGFLGLLGESCT